MFQIVTCNSVYKNGKYINGYHEIHEISNLKNVKYLIGFIKSVVKNNVLFKSDDATLDMVIICGDNTKVLEEIVNYYEENPIGVKILEAETALC